MDLRMVVCGIDYIKKFDTTDYKVKIAAEIKDFDPEQYMTKKDVKRNDLFAIYALAAGMQAFEDSKLDMEKEDADRIGVNCRFRCRWPYDNGRAGKKTDRQRTIKSIPTVYYHDDR